MGRGEGMMRLARILPNTVDGRIVQLNLSQRLNTEQRGDSTSEQAKPYKAMAGCCSVGLKLYRAMPALRFAICICQHFLSSCQIHPDRRWFS